MTSAPATGWVFSSRAISASAGGQLEQPSEVNSSTSTGVRLLSVGRGDAETPCAAAPLLYAVPAAKSAKPATTHAKLSRSFLCIPPCDPSPLYLGCSSASQSRQEFASGIELRGRAALEARRHNDAQDSVVRPTSRTGALDPSTRGRRYTQR